MSCSVEPSEFIRIALRETDSTNNALREALEDKTMGELPEFFTIVTAFQFSGRGQRGNSWESEPGKNLLFSTLLHPVFLKANAQFRLSQMVSLAVTDFLGKYAPGEPFFIKWPNDLYWKDRKICGMLIEHDTEGTFLADSIVGIGLNVNQQEFRSEAPNPCSLIHILGEESDLNQCLIRLMACLRRRYYQLREEVQAGDCTSWEAQYNALLYRADGKWHPFRDAGGDFQARIVRVEPDGVLRLECEDGTERAYLFKEVEFRPV